LPKSLQIIKAFRCIGLTVLVRLAHGPVPWAFIFSAPATGGPAHGWRKDRPRAQVPGLNEKELQNNQNIIIIPTMSKIVGYMVTWTTYGTWLPGDERGFVENGQILQGDLKTLERNKKRQKSPIVKLNRREIKLVRQVILSEAERIGHEIKALTVCTNHVHLAARPNIKSIEDIIGRYKSITTHTLWKHGRKGRIWTIGYDKRFCFSEEELKQRIQYVNKHNLD